MRSVIKEKKEKKQNEISRREKLEMISGRRENEKEKRKK